MGSGGLRPTYSCAIFIPDRTSFLLCKRKLIIITPFPHRIVQRIEEIIHEYALENIIQLGGSSYWASQGSLQHWVSTCSVRSRWEGGWSLTLISNTSEQNTLTSSSPLRFEIHRWRQACQANECHPTIQRNPGNVSNSLPKALEQESESIHVVLSV